MCGSLIGEVRPSRVGPLWRKMAGSAAAECVPHKTLVSFFQAEIIWNECNQQQLYGDDDDLLMLIILAIYYLLYSKTSPWNSCFGY